MACLPKTKWLKEIESDVEWPFHGLPEVLHLDNAAEFHSEALRRGCDRYGIQLAYRPRGRPHTGGHIERYLGTLMRRIHGLPGTTSSNVKSRGKYPSEKRAALTLRELEAWLTLEIAGRYHAAIHRGLHCSPTEAWRRATERGVPGVPKNADAFTLDFLPLVHRKISKDGFQLFHIRYWDPLLPRVFPSSQRQIVRFNPRNLSRVWVAIPERREYIPVPYADLRRPPISQYEQEAAMRDIIATGRRTANEDIVFATIERQRQLVDRARSTTRSRRLRSRRPSKRLIVTPDPGATERSAAKIDFSKPATPYRTERWLR